VPAERDLLSFTHRDEWRAWLAGYHDRAAEAWLVIYKTGPRRLLLTLHDAQEEALCFGWIEVSNKRLDADRYTLRFTPRKRGSAWSISNIRRVEKLTAAGLMTDAGLQKVEEAHHNGQWAAALRIEQTDLIPGDLEKALRQQDGALTIYRNLSRSRKRQILRGLLSAKSEATRQRRIEAIVQEAVAGRAGLISNQRKDSV
jgi:uncharacterized protein YdeI (YjbR/CyaY-like superfamily)